MKRGWKYLKNNSSVGYKNDNSTRVDILEYNWKNQVKEKRCT